jgi:chromosomal replication initiation ATPase DnaA
LATQLTFDLPSKTALGRDAFFVSTSNALAVTRLEGWRDWPGRRMVLLGPTGSGKTHLAHVWATETGAHITNTDAVNEASVEDLAAYDFLVVEDVNRLAGDGPREAAMFHLYNLVDARGGVMLMTADTAPARWSIGLADLKSRLSSVDLVQLQAPDDALLGAVLLKLFQDRQIGIDDKLIPYLVARMERSAIAAQVVVARLDALSLELKRPVNRRLAAGLF